MTDKNSHKPVTVAFVALGCPKNMVDSERMLAEIAREGFLIAAEPDDADVIVINTCGFIAPAKAEALREIKNALKRKRNGTVRKVIAAGCLPQRLGTQLFNLADGIDAIIGLDQRDNIAHIIKKTLSAKKPLAYLNTSFQKISDDRTRLLISPHHWAYLRISEGCSHHCSFCTVPAIRGPFRSKPKELILAEANELVEAGAVELNIIAQDTTNYGRDLKIYPVRNKTPDTSLPFARPSNGVENGLSTLLKELEKINNLKWIRLMYSYPTGITPQLIQTIADSKKIVKYIDIPIQHINNEILKDMRRPYTREKISSLIDNLRTNIPDIILRTTMIVGFPGETDRQFEELLQFVKSTEFDCFGCFQFYPEADTKAAKMSPQVPERIKKQRLKEIMLTQQKIAFEKNKKRINNRLTCLVDSVDNKGNAQARFYGQAPVIDSFCIVKNCSAKPGQFIDAKVVDTKDYDLIVEQI
jgi:ribosomal protein S12 methylthiotransferase